jgi:hypothetical protein
MFSLPATRTRYLLPASLTCRLALADAGVADPFHHLCNVTVSFICKQGGLLAGMPAAQQDGTSPRQFTTGSSTGRSSGCVD